MGYDDDEEYGGRGGGDDGNGYDRRQQRSASPPKVVDVEKIKPNTEENKGEIRSAPCSRRAAHRRTRASSFCGSTDCKMYRRLRSKTATP